MAPELAEMATAVKQMTIDEAGDRALEMVDQSFCSKCNKQNDIGAKFCNACGTPLATTSQLPLFTPGQNVAKAPEQVVADQFIGGGTQTAAQPTNPPKFVQAMRTGLPNISMDIGTMKNILGEVYNRMHSHIFEKCGFQVCGTDTGVATGFNPAMIGNILQPISIADIPRATELIIGYDKSDPATGKTIMKVSATDGLIAGKIAKTNQLPMYAIYINNNGTECKRLIMAQNPFKTNANGYTAPAEKAQQGNKISWVWDGGDGKQYRTWFYKNENSIAKWL